MTSTVPMPRLRQSRPLLALGLAFLLVTLLLFLAREAHYVTDYSLPSYSAYFWSRRTGLLFHLAGGFCAVTTGLVQIWLGLTQRTTALHRNLGKLYVCGVVIGSVGGFYLGFTIPAQLSYKAGLICMNVAWLVTTATALFAIRTRRIEQHREWMLRSYVVTFAFVTFRLSYVLLSILQHQPIQRLGSAATNEVASTVAWASWAIPLLFAETLIQLRRMRVARAGIAA